MTILNNLTKTTHTLAYIPLTYIFLRQRGVSILVNFFTVATLHRGGLTHLAFRGGKSVRIKSAINNNVATLLPQ
jgi:hypothetical protein